jgi:hypothetical protein
MAKWNNIFKLGEKDEKQRESAFEAAMMAELAKVKAASPPKPPPIAPILAPASDSISITATEAGKTTTYTDLAAVPVTLRQRVMNAWLAAPPK